jgi:hypothetical protein
MGFISRFKQIQKREPAAKSVSLAVLYATARDGLAAEQCFALRDLISAAFPLGFYFLNPGSFVVFFDGAPHGRAQAEQLATVLRQHACDNAISSFGVAVGVGDCIAAFDNNGRLASMPLGLAISHTMSAAIEEATALVA